MHLRTNSTGLNQLTVSVEVTPLTKTSSSHGVVTLALSIYMFDETKLFFAKNRAGIPTDISPPKPSLARISSASYTLALR